MKIILIYSGGLDSTVLLYHLRQQGHSVKALSIDYGQRHSRELVAARDICLALEVEQREANLSALLPFLGGSSQTDSDIAVPKGHYADKSMRATVVPNRNMLMLAVATAWAISSGFDAVAYAAHAGDHAIYPDCRQSFIEAMRKVLSECDYNQIQLLAPFSGISKADIVKLGASLKVPFAQTWSCYCGRELHCGCCGTCYERREAFDLAGIPDPTEYERAIAYV